MPPRTGNRLPHWSVSLAVLASCIVLTPLRAEPPATAPDGRAILVGNSIWRCQFVHRKPVVRRDGQLLELFLDSYNGVWRPEAKLTATMDTPPPPVGWTAPDFDDRDWPRLRGPFFPTQHAWAWTKQTDDMGFLGYEGTAPSLAAICVRGRFMVSDPAAAGDMKLSLVYRGGVVVHLNGREIARANVAKVPSTNPDLAEDVLAPADDYPPEAFVTDEGKVIGNYTDTQKYYDRLTLRLRRLEAPLPGRLLVKGANVLAIEGHRSPYHEAIYSQGRSAKGYVINWATAGVVRIELRATGQGVEPNAGRPEGMQLWNQPTDQRPNAADYASPCEPLDPVRIIAARNGAFSGQIVVGSTKPLLNPRASVSRLSGPADLPPSAVQVRYAIADPDQRLSFDVLSPSPPAEVAVDKAGGAAVMPVWITVRLPADARCGEYRGTVTVSADGQPAISAPISLTVVNWTLPDAGRFVSHMGLTESPESVAMRYNVPLWSPRHWELLDEVFALMGQAGADDVFLTALSKTHHGNEHAMVRRVKQADGSLGVDLSIAEKYLDLAIKHLGKVPVVCLYCWEPCTGSLYGGKASGDAAGVTYTVLDPGTGELSEAIGPKWGQPEARTFWKPVFDAVGAMLAKRGMSKSLMIGVAGDRRPNKDAVDDLRAVAPEAGWVIQSHMTGSELFGQKVTYLADVWNSPGPPNPSIKRVYGWQNPFLRVSFPRAGSYTLIRPDSPLAQYRLAMEMTSTAGIHGIGRVGADFWNVLATRNKTYGQGLSLIARYPQSDWGQLYLGNSTAYVIAPGPEGPLATARFEMLRQGAQDLEARVFLEKALLDAASRARLGDDLAGRCQQLLDDRVRAMILGRSSWLLFTGGEQRLRKLYELAAEAAARLGE